MHGNLQSCINLLQGQLAGLRALRLNQDALYRDTVAQRDRARAELLQCQASLETASQSVSVSFAYKQRDAARKDADRMARQRDVSNARVAELEPQLAATRERAERAEQQLQRTLEARAELQTQYPLHPMLTEQIKPLILAAVQAEVRKLFAVENGLPPC